MSTVGRQAVAAGPAARADQRSASTGYHAVLAVIHIT